MQHDERISELLLEWEAARENGRSPTPEELCRDQPELIQQVRGAIEALEARHRVPMQSSAGSHLRESDAPGPLPRVAGYELLEELGSGGMGVVYRARHTQLKRNVAIKMIRGGTFAGRVALARFRIEAEAAARLQHPNIVQIFEIDEHQGFPFLALEFVAGPTLAQFLQSGPLAPRSAAELAQSLAAAVQYAHERGIVHRDLKPSNVLLDDERPTVAVDPEAEVSVLQRAGRLTPSPKITDFGLARLLDSNAEHTRTGDVMGTPGYMAPEQAEGRRDDIGPATDIYALGAILFEMLAGRPPFVSDSAFATLEQARSIEPAPPSRYAAGVPRDLDAICLKCLEKSPVQRYATAAELADDLGRFLTGRPIAARAVGPFGRLVRTLAWNAGSGPLSPLYLLILLLSPTPFLTNLLVFALYRAGSPYTTVAIGFMALAAPVNSSIIYFAQRRRSIGPMGPLERQFWSIWIGVGAGVVALFFAYARPPTANEPLPALWLYPAAAVLHGLAFFSMGSGFWGGCYVAGAAFFAAALIMPARLEWAPLEFGAVLSATIVSAGIHMRRKQLALLRSVASPHTPAIAVAATVPYRGDSA